MNGEEQLSVTFKMFHHWIDSNADLTLQPCLWIRVLEVLAWPSSKALVTGWWRTLGSAGEGSGPGATVWVLREFRIVAFCLVVRKHFSILTSMEVPL